MLVKPVVLTELNCKQQRHVASHSNQYSSHQQGNNSLLLHFPTRMRIVVQKEASFALLFAGRRKQFAHQPLCSTPLSVLS